MTDKSKTLSRTKIQVNKSEGELLGLKHFLGHVENLPYSDSGLALSKSSYRLNKLQDVQKKKEMRITKRIKTLYIFYPSEKTRK